MYHAVARPNSHPTVLLSCFRFSSMPALSPITDKPLSLGALPSRLLAGLRLARPANLVTAAADVLAGGVIVGAGGRPLACLVGASVSLYAGGVVLNDYFDRHLDAVERPERPIPTGLVPAGVAAGAGAALLALGVLLAACASFASGLLGALLAAFVLLYDAFAKTRSIGPVVMGSCRACNLLLGLSAVPAMLEHTWFLALIPFLYIVAVTTLSRGEVHGGTQATARFALVLFAAVLLGLAMVGGDSPLHLLRLLPFAVLLAVRVGAPLWQAYLAPSAGRIRAAVHAGIVSLIVLDAALAAPRGGVIAAAAILSLAVLAAELARLFPVT